MKVILKRDLDKAYLEFIEEKKLEYELYDYEEDFDFIEYMKSDKGKIWDDVGDIIRTVYCPGENDNEWEEWQLGSDEEINIGDLFKEICVKLVLAYDSMQHFWLELLYGIENYEKTKDFYGADMNEVIKRKDYLLGEMIKRVDEVDISKDGEISYNWYTEYKDNCERWSKGDSRWILIKPIIELFDCLEFEDVYDFGAKEINDVFDEVLEIKEKVMAVREQMENDRDYDGISLFDLDCLNLHDFSVEDGELKIIGNKSIYDVIMNMELEKVVEEDMDLGR